MQVQPLGAEEGIYLLQLPIFRAGEAGRLRPGGFHLGFFWLLLSILVQNRNIAAAEQL